MSDDILDSWVTNSNVWINYIDNRLIESRNIGLNYSNLPILK